MTAEEIRKTLQREFVRTIRKPFMDAVKEYDMVRPGDRVAVCISGGKDSMLLGLLLRDLQHTVDFELKFLAMDPGYAPEGRRHLEENARKLDIPLEIFDTDVLRVAGSHSAEHPCFLCAKMRRGYLYAEAKKRGCKVMMYGCGIGPIHSPANRRRASRVLQRSVDAITLRDTHSAEELEDMGVTKPQVILSADPTVILPAAPAQVVDGILESQGIAPHGRYIGFALRPWPGFEAKAAVFGAAADYAYETYGLTPVFLPIERRLDVGAAQLAAQHMKAPHYILPQTGRSDHTIGLFARMQAVVSMRLHALVFSAGQGVPLVGVVYDQKISSFLSYIGQDLYTGLDEVTEEALRAHIDAACARIGDEAFLSGGVERLRQVERRNSETARMLLER